MERGQRALVAGYGRDQDLEGAVQDVEDVLGIEGFGQGGDRQQQATDQR